MERYERGLRLARQIDAKGELPKSVLAHLEARVRHYDGQDPLFFTCKALEFLAEFQFGDFPALAEIAGRVAAKSCEGGDFRRARNHFDVQAKLLKLAKDDVAAEAARVASAETHALVRKGHSRRLPVGFFDGIAYLRAPSGKWVAAYHRTIRRGSTKPESGRR